MAQLLPHFAAKHEAIDSASSRGSCNVMCMECKNAHCTRPCVDVKVPQVVKIILEH